MVKIVLWFLFLLNSDRVFSQNIATGKPVESNSTNNALQLYHEFLTPETSLYNGRQYAYNVYYPFRFSAGDPFFISKIFDTGVVFYNNILFRNVRMLYDEVKGELIISDPTRVYLIKLTTEKVDWFTIYSHTFINFKTDTIKKLALRKGFYDLLYNGNISLYNKVSKKIEEVYSTSEVTYKVRESNEYFISKDGNYHPVKNSKELKAILPDKKKEIDQFIRKNKLRERKLSESSLIKIVAYYDMLSNKKTIEIN